MSSGSTIEILGHDVEVSHLMAGVLCVIVALFFLSRGGNNASASADSSAESPSTKSRKAKRRNKKKKKKKKAVAEAKAAADSDSEQDSSNSDDDDSDASPAPAQATTASKKNKKKGAAKKSSSKKASTYVPTAEDERKRKERAEKRRLKELARQDDEDEEVFETVPVASEQSNKKKKKKNATQKASTKDAGKITKKGIVGLARQMTKEDSASSWETVGGSKKKKKSKASKAQIQSSHEPNARVVPVPTSKVGMIIGSGGLTLRKIEAETGCTISVSFPCASLFTTAQPRLVWNVGATHLINARTLHRCPRRPRTRTQRRRLASQSVARMRTCCAR